MSVPIVDFAAFDPSDRPGLERLAGELDVALTSHGFIAVTNVGVSPELRDRAFASAGAFFARPAADKARFRYTDPVANFGYQPPLSETLEPGKPADIKEAFTMRNLVGRFDDAHAWPSAEFRSVAREFYEACLMASFRLLKVFAVALDVPDDFFMAKHTGENITMRYLHYPDSGYTVSGDDQLGAGAHTDYGSVTLLFQDAVGGLQLKRADGTWLDVPPVPDAVNINTGDLMSHWSNGRYPSTEHRVLPRIGYGERQSIAFFTDPDNATAVRCLPSCVSSVHPAAFADTTAGAHIQAKIDASQSPDAAEVSA